MRPEFPLLLTLAGCTDAAETVQDSRTDSAQAREEDWTDLLPVVDSKKRTPEYIAALQLIADLTTRFAEETRQQCADTITDMDSALCLAEFPISDGTEGVPGNIAAIAGSADWVTDHNTLKLELRVAIPVEGRTCEVQWTTPYLTDEEADVEVRYMGQTTYVANQALGYPLLEGTETSPQEHQLALYGLHQLVPALKEMEEGEE